MLPTKHNTDIFHKVIGDCCGTCPEPKTPEEIEIAEKESEIYVSGKVTFRIDDPGRQASTLALGKSSSDANSFIANWFVPPSHRRGLDRDGICWEHCSPLPSHC